MDSKNVEMQFTLPVETVKKLNLLTNIINQFGSPCYGDNQYGSREQISLNDIIYHILGNLADGVIPEESNKWEQSLLADFGLSPCCSTEEIKVALIEFDKTLNEDTDYPVIVCVAPTNFFDLDKPNSNIKSGKSILNDNE